MRKCLNGENSKWWRVQSAWERRGEDLVTSDDFEVGVVLDEVGGQFKHSEVQVGGGLKDPHATRSKGLLELSLVVCVSLLKGNW